ncbi:MAG: hypothetical protein JXB26_12610 [Candidatus Aminicenantes bacterium]|nr:hypothetical protein [Candidatus Aminicenantes bacterium]
MKRPFRDGKIHPPFFIVLFLLVSCGLFMGLKIHIDHIPRKSIPGASVIFIPSGKYLKYATFGYSSLAADLIYLWAIQYYSDYSITERYLYLDHIFSIINELDPRYLDPYEVGAQIAAFEAGDVNLALKILDRGMEKNPDEWIFPFEAGHYARNVKKDFNLARNYFYKASQIKGSPPLMRRLYASAALGAEDYQTAWNTWLEIYQTTRDEKIKKLASNHLYQVKSAKDITLLQEAIEAYKKRYGHHPSDLEQLVKTGLIRAVPRDLDDENYIYDPETGNVESVKIWWKR